MSDRPRRRLAAILAADVVSYSRLMGEDQDGTLAALRALRQDLFGPAVRRQRGNLVKSMGDGWIVEFPSISDAVACALEIQAGLVDHARIRLRYGIHTGEVVFEDDDVFGDGVNVAARLEALAEPGQLLISDTAYNSLDSKTAAQFAGGGLQKLKNIARSIAVWGVPAFSARSEVKSEPLIKAMPAPDKPSIAVLPFRNLSTDEEQEYFADGITEDIIGALSRFQWLFVIARNSSFAFKGKSPDLRAVSEALGVRYVLDGSIRRAASRVRISGQLTDTASEANIWSNRFDGVIDDIFELQDKVTIDVVGAIEPSLRQAEAERVRIKPTEDLQAYELYLRGQSHFHLVTDADNRTAIALLSKAMEKDPGYAVAAGLLAWCYLQRAIQNWGIEEGDVPRAIQLAEQVLVSDRADAMALAYAAHVIVMFVGDHLRARRAFERSLTDNPHSALANALYAVNEAMLGEAERAVKHADLALALSPRDTFRYTFLLTKALPLIDLGRYQEAAEAAQASVDERRGFLLTHYALIAALQLGGDHAAARHAVEDLRALSPDPTLSKIVKSARFLQNESADQMRQALLDAGIPK